MPVWADGIGEAAAMLRARGPATGRAMLAALAALALASGCATARGSRAEPETIPLSATPPALAEDRDACEQEALDGFDSARARLAIRHAAVGMLAWSLLGAAEGAWFGALQHSGAGTGAWIGAAAGAGVGLALGVFEGWRQAGDARAGYLAAVQACLARGPAPPGGPAASDGPAPLGSAAAPAAVLSGP